MPLVGGVMLGTFARSERHVLVGSAVLGLLFVWFKIDGFFWREIGWYDWVVGWIFIAVGWPVRVAMTAVAVALWAAAARGVIQYRRRKSVAG